MMKTCKWCKAEIDKATSCGGAPVVGFNQRWVPIVFGEEKDFTEGTEKCPKCKVIIKGRHHAYCPVEQCPNCNGKINDCGCFYKIKEE
ncbi:MAG: hypothetical protein ACYSSM_04740 [Planctomycetota bacterium]